ncbi:MULTISPECIES: GumC family protein [Bradyrhizobium]|uniref:GumC family protein n=1 Tax=Bradyrhizobium elkanii TaxID=29448 RepID=UPI0027153FE8|nr:exopolysaccharide transport family protein [Bradyrhizobium elkanii]WLA52135.1 exopolysaccharide transport family protein [Bradyrhizobium elkanii]WLB77528.1 exopolysaccharide transport family protein [Bradyrhizobium elkanii]
MRFAFWRRGKDKAVVQRALPKSAPVADEAVVKPAAPKLASDKPAPDKPARPAEAADLDLHVLGRALARKRGWIIVPTVLVFALSLAAVNVVTPRYKSEARILIDNRENAFLRPNGERDLERTSLDAEAVTSQVQLLLSRDLARDIIKKNKLAERPEFDPVLRGFSPLKSLLALFGIGRDPFSLTPEERVLDSYYERFQAFAVDKSRVMVIEFQSEDPELAARVANSIADGYLVLQQAARQDQAKSASTWLLGEIDKLRTKVADADSRVEEFRSKSSLFVGTNNIPLSNQQMGELNTQLNNARALKADAETKARLIREMLQGGKPIEASEVLNSELIRRLAEQRGTLRAQLAEQSSTLLDNHPRIKELKAQIADLDRQLREEAGKVSRSLDNDARVADGRVMALQASLDQSKKQASSSNSQDVQLRGLEREAKAQRDLLEAYLAKYREATARENIEAAPTDGRIISRASVSNTPAYPKKLPIVLIATLATLLLSSGIIITGELLRISAPGAVGRAFAPAAAVIRRREPVMDAATADQPAPALPPEPALASPVAPRPAVEPELPLEPAAAYEPAPSEPQPASAQTADEIDELAERLVAAGPAAHKVTVLGPAAAESVTLTALTLARLMARQAKVVVIDLVASSLVLTSATVDPAAPGLAELMQGEATFAQIITKDRQSRVQIVSAGRPGFDRSHLQSPRLALAIDALLRVYDHVLLDAGSAVDLPAELLTAKAQAVVVPDAAMAQDARHSMVEQLRAVGFAEVTMLSKPCAASEAVARGPRVVAA